MVAIEKERAVRSRRKKDIPVLVPLTDEQLRLKQFKDTTNLEWGYGAAARLNASERTPLIYLMKLRNGELTLEDMVAVGKLSMLKEYLISEGFKNPVNIMTEGFLSTRSDNMLRGTCQDAGVEITAWDDIKLEYRSVDIHASLTHDQIASRLMPKRPPYVARGTLLSLGSDWNDILKEGFFQADMIESIFKPVKIRIGADIRDIGADVAFFKGTPKLVLLQKLKTPVTEQ